MKRLKKAILVGFISFSIIYMMSVSLVLLLDEDGNGAEGGGAEVQFLPIVIEYEIKGIRLTFIHNFNDSVVISWFTDWLLDNYEPFVRYSSESDLSNFIEIKANRKYISGTFIYTAELVDLRPNRTYFYQIRCDEYSKREIMSFTTMANNTDHIRFLVWGDTQAGLARGIILSQKMMENNFKDNFEFTIKTGDIVDDGREQYQWDDYFIGTECLNAYKQGIYCEGNHDTNDGKSPVTEMYDNLPMGNNYTNRYYSFSYGGIGFIILNSNKYAEGDDIQTDWLNQTLIQFSQENLFNLVFLHHPLLHDERAGESDYYRANWRPLFEQYNVSIIFSGHNHHYERSYPIINSSVNPETIEFNNSTLYNYTYLNDPIYIVSGGGGHLLYEPDRCKCSTHDFRAKFEKALHFLLIDVKKKATRTTLSLEAWGMPTDFGDLFLFDNFTISKQN
ncbi:MAG: purple acid phosphatase family protein [Candidatus Hodarchaeota archaeon]